MRLADGVRVYVESDAETRGNLELRLTCRGPDGDRYIARSIDWVRDDRTPNEVVARDDPLSQPLVSLEPTAATLLLKSLEALAVPSHRPATMSDLARYHNHRRRVRRVIKDLRKLLEEKAE